MNTQKIYKTFADLPSTGLVNEIVLVEDENKIFTYTVEQGWIPIDKDNIKISGLTIYEINRMVMDKMSTLAKKQIKEAKKLIREYIDYNQSSQYFMLLCNDIHYYTVFHRVPIMDGELFEDILIQLLSEQGDIKSINYNTDKTGIECWINTVNDGIRMFLLFDYDWGVVACV